MNIFYWHLTWPNKPFPIPFQCLPKVISDFSSILSKLVSFMIRLLRPASKAVFMEPRGQPMVQCVELTKSSSDVIFTKMAWSAGDMILTKMARSPSDIRQVKRLGQPVLCCGDRPSHPTMQYWPKWPSEQLMGFLPKWLGQPAIYCMPKE